MIITYTIHEDVNIDRCRYGHLDTSKVDYVEIDRELGNVSVFYKCGDMFGTKTKFFNDEDLKFLNRFPKVHNLTMKNK